VGDKLTDPNSNEPKVSIIEGPEDFLQDSVGQAVSGRVRLIDRALGSQIIRWATKGGLAIVDQGFIAGSNFVMSILLARWLAVGAYGAYATAAGLFLLLLTLYQSLLLEPMGVFGGGAYRDRLRGYLGKLVWIHVVITGVIVFGLGVSALVSERLGQQDGLPGALAGLALAAPALLLFGMARRSFYLQLTPAGAAAGAFVYSVLVLGGFFVFNWRGLMSPFTAFLLMGLGGLVTAIILLAQLRSALPPGGTAPDIRETWRRHWGYGRWALASCIASWIPAYIYYPLLGTFSGLEKAGQLKALMNLAAPLTQLQAAFGMLLIPYAARICAQEGKAGARSLSMRITWLAAIAGTAYWAVIIPLKGTLFHLLYGGKFTEVAHFIPAVAVGSIFWAAAYGSSVVLRGMEAPDSVFMAFCAATVVSLIVGIPATWAFGLAGGIWGINLSDAASFFMVLYLLSRRAAQKNESIGEI